MSRLAFSSKSRPSAASKHHSGESSPLLSSQSQSSLARDLDSILVAGDAEDSRFADMDPDMQMEEGRASHASHRSMSSMSSMSSKSSRSRKSGRIGSSNSSMGGSRLPEEDYKRSISSSSSSSLSSSSLSEESDGKSSSSSDAISRDSKHRGDHHEMDLAHITHHDDHLHALPMDGQLNRKVIMIKKPPFIERHMEVDPTKACNDRVLLEELRSRFHRSYKRWKHTAKFFEAANLLVTVMLVCFQVAQVIIFQLPEISPKTKQIVATILSATTASVLALQLKLGWADKAAKSERSALLCGKLLHHAEYRISVLQAGGHLHDVVKLWNVSLQIETKDIPPFLIPY